MTKAEQEGIYECKWSPVPTDIETYRSHKKLLNMKLSFLKKNKDLWGIRDVNMANEDRKAGKRIERMEEKKKNEKELVDLLEDLDL